MNKKTVCIVFVWVLSLLLTTGIVHYCTALEYSDIKHFKNTIGKAKYNSLDKVTIYTEASYTYYYQDGSMDTENQTSSKEVFIK